MRVPRATLLALTRQIPPQPVDPAYWLARCDGFEVWSPSGRVGVVAEIVPAGPHGGAELVVLCGMFRRRRVRVPAADIRTIEPDRLRLTLEHELPGGREGDVVDARRFVHRRRARVDE
jgi:hypothetical protein